MNKEQTKAAAAVMLAAAEGKKIEYRNRFGPMPSWCAVGEHQVVWNWHGNEYRVKPEPRRGTLHIETRATFDGVPNRIMKIQSVEAIELTPEVEKALKDAGVIS